MRQEIHVDSSLLAGSDNNKVVEMQKESTERVSHNSKFTEIRERNDKEEYKLIKKILDPKYFMAFRVALESQNKSFTDQDFKYFADFTDYKDKIVTKIGRYVLDMSLETKKVFFELMDEQISPLLHQKQESTESSNLDKNDQVIEPNEIKEIDPDLLKGAIAHKDELGYDDDEDKDEDEE